ncbi:ABC transporter permease [Planctomycetota bacterium]
MNSLCYPRMIVNNQRGLMLFSMIVTAAIQFIIIWLIKTIDYEPIMASIMEQLPTFFRLFFEEELINRFSARGGAAFGFNHPIVLSLLAINAIIISARHIAGEIEKGTLELLLAYPVKRTKLLMSLWVSGSMILLLIIAAAGVSSIAAVAIYHDLTNDIFISLLKIVGNLWLFFILIMSFTLVISTFSKEAGKAGLLSAAALLIFYFLHFISRIWEAIGFIKPLNIFTYYQPQKMMFGERSFALHLAVLSTLIVICVIISIKQINRRDIP